MIKIQKASFEISVFLSDMYMYFGFDTRCDDFFKFT
jgi:hypothetical protein